MDQKGVLVVRCLERVSTWTCQAAFQVSIALKEIETILLKPVRLCKNSFNVGHINSLTMASQRTARASKTGATRYAEIDRGRRVG